MTSKFNPFTGKVDLVRTLGTTSQTAAAGDDESLVIARNSYTTNAVSESVGKTFFIERATFQQEGSTNSGWGGSIGVRKNFQSVSFYIRPWDAASLMTSIRCLVKIGDYTGTVLADKTIAVSVVALTPQKITVTFDAPIENADGDSLWFDFKCNGKTGVFSRLTPNATPITRIYQGNSQTTSGINVTAGNEKEIYFEFSGTGVGAGVTNELTWKLKESLGVPQDLALDEVFTANITLPMEIFAVEGVETNLYFDNIIYSPLPLSMFEIDITCTKGKHFAKYWRITPVEADAGTYTFTIALKIAGYTIAQKVSTLNIVAATAGGGVSRKVTIIGDSTTVGAIATSGELSVLFTGDTDYVLTLQGTQGSGANKHEGYSGRTFNWHYTNASSPFVFSGVFDFAQYLTNNSFTLTADDWVIFNLGINDLNNSPNGLSDAVALTTITQMKSDLDAMIVSVKAAVSGIRIGIVMTIPPAINQDPYGAVYSSLQSRWNYRRQLNWWHQDILSYYDTYTNKSNDVYVLPMHSFLDTEYNMTTAATALNSRNATTYDRITDAIHPATIGYYQLCDFYRCFLKVKI